MELKSAPEFTTQEELDMIAAVEAVEEEHIPKVVVRDDDKISIWFRMPMMKLALDLEHLHYEKGMNEGRIELITQQMAEDKFPPSFSVRKVLSVSG